MVGVLNVEPMGAALDQAAHELLRSQVITSLGVKGARHLNNPRDARGSSEDLIGRRLLMIGIAETVCYGQAGGRHNRKARIDDEASARGIPSFASTTGSPRRCRDRSRSA